MVEGYFSVLNSLQLTFFFICRSRHKVSFPDGSAGKESACQCRRHQRCGFNPCIRKIPGAENGNPLQHSCLENSMDKGAWWAAVSGVAKRWIWLSNWAQSTSFSSGVDDVSWAVGLFSCCSHLEAPLGVSKRPLLIFLGSVLGAVQYHFSHSLLAKAGHRFKAAPSW